MNDQAIRAQCLNTALSFIVQAPAGSGKTELLIQRMLAILSRVEHPRQVLTITFSRKATHELQTRLSHALNGLSQNTQTQRLVKEVQAHAILMRWDDTADMARSVMTLDAWCAQIVGAQISSQIVEDSDSLYEEAAIQMVQLLETPGPWMESLQHCVSVLGTQRLTEVLTQLLATRDGWLPFLGSSPDPQQLVQRWEAELDKLWQRELSVLNAIPGVSWGEFRQLLHNSQTEQGLDWSQWPHGLQQDYTIHWKYVAAQLLTQKGTWRIKTVFKDLIARLKAHDNVLEHFQTILQLPAPNFYAIDPPFWQAMVSLLPYTLAQLRVVFNRVAQVDFCEIALQALQSLKAGEYGPCRDIRHLLVDEFQDTSQLHYELLRQLVSTWDMSEPHSVFVVGDPMQSIYRFRHADVQIFAHVQAHGFGGVLCQSLKLRQNFRARPTLIEWGNTHFTQMLQANQNHHFFSCAIAQRETDEIPRLDFSAVDSEEEETQLALQHIKAALANPAISSVGVLLRARQHGRMLLRSLMQDDVAFVAQRLVTYWHIPLMRDLAFLTRALADPNDRMAWLCLLRAPWCGLNHLDLLHIANHEAESIWQALALSLPLSEEGTQLVQRFYRSLNPIWTHIGTKPWSVIVKMAWLALSGPNCYANVGPAQAFFDWLATLQRPIVSVNFEHELSGLYWDQWHPEARVHLMTIHQAKGLEFDAVILMGLHKGVVRHTSDTVLWHRNHLNATPFMAFKTLAPNPLYQWMLSQEKKAQHAESMRLFYVATTRARERLTFVYHNTSCTQNTFLHFLRGVSLPLESPIKAAVESKRLEVTTLTRLPLDWRSPYCIPILEVAVQAPEPSWTFQLERRIAQWLRHCHFLPPSSWAQLPPHWLHACLSDQGCPAQAVTQYQQQATQWLERSSQEPFFQKMIGQCHGIVLSRCAWWYYLENDQYCGVLLCWQKPSVEQINSALADWQKWLGEKKVSGSTRFYVLADGSVHAVMGIQ